VIAAKPKNQFRGNARLHPNKKENNDDFFSPDSGLGWESE